MAAAERDLPGLLGRLGRWVAVSSGRFEAKAACASADLRWNHLDRGHRPFVHETYGESVRLEAAPSAQISLAALRVLGLPLLVPVAEMQVDADTFVQSLTILNLFYVHIVIRCADRAVEVEWSVASHALLRPLHGLVHRRLRRLNEGQNAQDAAIRGRRADLRARGYRFEPERYDFVTANDERSHVVAPPITAEVRLPLSGLTAGRLNRAAAGVFELVIRPDEGGGYSVWNGVCPHEGGPLAAGRDCGGEIQCAWHGLKFPCVKLTAERPRARLGAWSLALDAEKDALVVGP